jgi:hypothetical protein
MDPAFTYRRNMGGQAMRVRDLMRDHYIPAIVCLCGSTRFWREFQDASLQFTLAGFIVLSVGAATASDADHGITPEQKYQLDQLHKRKIDLADFIFVLNAPVDGQPYIGSSTQSEINYARTQNIRIFMLTDHDFEFLTVGQDRPSYRGPRAQAPEEIR